MPVVEFALVVVTEAAYRSVNMSVAQQEPVVVGCSFPADYLRLGRYRCFVGSRSVD